MKSVSAILVGAVAVAATDSYGNYGASSSSAKGYTTVNPGYGHSPVTVTSQYQPVPTYVDGKSSEYLYVSTVIKGYNGEYTTITNTDQDVVVYSTKSTATHYKTEPAQGYASPTGYGGYYPKNSTATASAKPYYELYEKVHEAKYKDLGPKALPGYPGSGLWKGDKDKQRVQIKEYKNGKWSAWSYLFDYGVPKPSATTFKNPGTYTIPSYDKTVKSTQTATVAVHTSVEAHKPVTYGGYTASVSKPTTITATIPHYETHAAKTNTVYKTKTVTCPSAGKYEIEKPTTTSYDHATTFVYPTVSVYEPGVYHHDKETVTVTKSNQPYTCSFHSTSTKDHSYPTGKPSTSSKHHDSYPTGKPSTSSKGHDSYPHETSTQGYEPYPVETGTKTSPPIPDPSSDYEEPVENYGTPYAGYVKRGGMLERRSAEPKVKNVAGKRVILV